MHGRVALEPEGWVALPAPAPAPPASKRSAVSESVPQDDAPRPRAPGPPANRGGEKRVRRGKLEIAARLDLHGFGQDKAEAALGLFLRREVEAGARVVLVVTGRGMRLSADGERKPGVLKQRLPEWLAAPGLRSIVSGYAEAHASHGGEGAFYVFLRRPAE